MGLDFRWRPGSRVKGNPNQVGCEILRLTKEKGRSLSTAEFVEEAKNPESPLHGSISTWDVETAAENWWKHEARQVMAQIEIYDDVSKMAVPLLINMEVAEYGHRYIETSLIAEREDLQESVLRDAKRALTAWEERFGRLQVIREDLAPIFKAISEVCGIKAEKKPKKRKKGKSESESSNLPTL